MKKLVFSLAILVGMSAAAEETNLEAILDGANNPVEKPAPKKPGKAAPQDPVKSLRKLFGKINPEQTIFFNQLEHGEMERALFQWSPAFGKSDFGKTANGKAMYGWLLFKNGLPLMGIETLFTANDPANVSPSLITLWKEMAPPEHPVWSQLWLENWNGRWTSVFGANQEVRVAAKSLNGFKDMAKIQSLLPKTQPGTFENNLLKWQIVLGQSTTDTAKAGQTLAVLMKQPNPAVGQDLMDLTAARMLYQNGYLDGAIKYYSKVPSKSDNWFEAQEEMGWAYLRKGQTQDTIAITQALNHSSIVWLSGPEASFLRSLAQLKVCDYKGVVKTLETFKDNFKDRTGALVKVSKDANTPEVMKLIEQRSVGPIEYPKMGSAIKMLPRWAIRDVEFGNLAKFYGGINAEAKRAGELYVKSLSQGSDRVGFQAGTERIKQMTEQRAAGVKSAMIARVQELAKEEVKETQEILSKLQIVEAEMIQQSTALDKMAARADKNKQPTVMKGKNKAKEYQIEFPGSDEVWFDELASYDVDVKGGCEGVKR